MSYYIQHPVWTVKDFMDIFETKKIEWNVEYQRSPKVWKPPKKKRLLDSILREFTIGMIFLRKMDGRYEILDGQQRLRTLYEFIGYFGKDEMFLTLPETPGFGNKSYHDLKKDIARWGRFINFKIPVCVIEHIDDESTATLFLRLQEGMRLNMAEKLNAMRGEMRNLIFELSQNRLLKRTNIEQTRFGHRLVCAQTMLLELNGDLESEPPYFPSIAYKRLEKMYKEYSNELPPRKYSVRMKKTFSLLKRMLGSDASVIKYTGDFLSIYSLIRYLNKKFSIKGYEKKIKKFLINFLSKVEGIKKDVDPDNPYRQYQEARRYQAKGYLKKRLDIILTKFLEQLPGLELRSPTRLFDYGQKLAIFAKYDGKCYFCPKKVDFDEAEFHHIKFYERDNGPTTVENGAPTHKSCHIKFHASHPDKK